MVNMDHQILLRDRTLIEYQICNVPSLVPLKIVQELVKLFLRWLSNFVRINSFLIQVKVARRPSRCPWALVIMHQHGALWHKHTLLLWARQSTIDTQGHNQPSLKLRMSTRIGSSATRPPK